MWTVGWLRNERRWNRQPSAAQHYADVVAQRQLTDLLTLGANMSLNLVDNLETDQDAGGIQFHFESLDSPRGLFVE